MFQCEVPKQYGWICPKCGRVYSPWTHRCDYCSNEVTITSWGSTPPTNIPPDGTTTIPLDKTIITGNGPNPYYETHQTSCSDTVFTNYMNHYADRQQDNE